MAPTRRAIRDELDSFLTYLMTAEIAVFANAVSVDGGRVSWASRRPAGRFIEERDRHSLDVYRGWLEAAAYSALLFDGSLLQVTYDFSGRELTAHRLAWVPCPFAIDPELLQVGSPLEVIDMYADGGPGDIELRTPIRFDFDLERAVEDHPATHMTLNSSSCRLACAAPLRLGHFTDFVFRNFYPDLWRAHPFFNGLSRRPWRSDTITLAETKTLHISWRR